MATDLGASLAEVINTSVLFDELLEKLENSILNAEDKLYNKCTLLLMYKGLTKNNKKHRRLQR